MLYFITGLVIGLIIGGGIVYFFIRSRSKESPSFNPKEIDTSAIDEDLAKKHENLQKMREYIQTKDKISNDDIQALLGVSDATATRYLDELEQEGLIRQVGKVGYQVHYEKMSP